MACFEGGGDDPHQCCAEARGEALTFHCSLSGTDSVSGSGAARREGDELVVRWWTADLSTGTVLAKDEVRTRLPAAASVRFKPPMPACDPPSIP